MFSQFLLKLSGLDSLIPGISSQSNEIPLTNVDRGYIISAATDYQNLKKELEENPTRSPNFSINVSETIQSTINCRRTMLKRVGEKNFMFHHERAGVSKKQLKDLERIPMTEVKLEKRAMGKYLLVRTIIPPTIGQFSGFSVPVADPSGSLAMLNYYCIPPTIVPIWGRDSKAIGDLDVAYPVGTILAIKEPVFKSGNPKDLLRVDSPTDAIILDLGSPFTEGVVWKGIKGLPLEKEIWNPGEKYRLTLEEWNTSAEKFYTNKQYLKANSFFSNGIEQHPNHPQVYLLYLNRSAARLSLEQYFGALMDARKALELMDPFLSSTSAKQNDCETSTAPAPRPTILNQQAKAMLRIGRAYYAMRSWEQASKAFELCLDAHPNLSEAVKGYDRCQRRMKEASTGVYDLDALYLKARKNQPRLDIADYIGPIKVKKIQGMGRGLVTTRDVQAGELLLANKAMMFLTEEEISSKTYRFSWMGDAGPVPEGGTHCSPPSQTCGYYSVYYKLLHRPWFAPLFGQLSLGPGVEKVAELLPKPLGLPAVDRPIPDDFVIDTEEVIKRCTVNWFALDKNARGLYPYSSFINHSCITNTSRCDIGDFQFFYARENLPKGTQIFTSYHGDYADYKDRQSSAKTWNQTPECPCDLCEEDRKDGPGREERLKMIEKSDKGKISMVIPRSKDISVRIQHLNKLIPTLEATYKHNRVRGGFKADMIHVYQDMGIMLGLLCKMMGRHDQAPYLSFPWFFKAVEACGMNIKGRPSEIESRSIPSPVNIPICSLPQVDLEVALNILVLVAGDYKSLGNAEKGKEWFEAARWVCYMMKGRSNELFRANMTLGSFLFPEWMDDGWTLRRILFRGLQYLVPLIFLAIIYYIVRGIWRFALRLW